MVDNYCLFHKNNELYYGFIKSQKKNKLVVIPLLGDEFSCPVSQTEYTWEGKEYEDLQEALEYLKEKKQCSEQRIGFIDVQQVYELCNLENQYTIDGLSDLFLENPQDPWERVALLQAVKKSKRLFQQKKSFFTPRTSDEIQEYDQKIENAEYLERQSAFEKVWLEKINHNYTPEIGENQTKEWKNFQVRLKQYFLNPSQHPEKNYFKQLLPNVEEKSIEFEQLAVRYLRFIKTPLSWGAFCLEKANVNNHHSDDVIEQVAAIKKYYDLELNSGDRTDLTHLEVFTVDGAATKDYDDALSIEKTEDGYCLYVHISDVASFIKEGDLLFDESSNKISSIYTLKETYPMLPKELSEDLLSLRAGSKKCAVTYQFNFDNNKRLIDYRIYMSLIFVSENITYEAFAEKIEADSKWNDLVEICNIQKGLRINNGGLDIKRHELEVVIDKPEKIKIRHINTGSKSYIIIQELALLVNYYSAKFCMKHQLPCVYRGQDEYELLGKNTNMKLLNLSDIKIKAAKVSLSPSKHHGLGLDYYLQTSSPIRRFLDLLAQQSIISYLKGKPIEYTKEQLYFFAEHSDQQGRANIALERCFIYHWKFKYLAQNKHKDFKITVIKSIKAGKSLINFDDIQLITEIYLPTYQDRESLLVRLEEVNPKLHTLIVNKR